jgi:hypothetical protein
MYSDDVLNTPHRRPKKVREVSADLDVVAESADGSFCGAIVAHSQAIVAGERRDVVTLEDYKGRRRDFPLLPAGFMIDGELVTLIRPVAQSAPQTTQRTRSGSVAVTGLRAQVAKKGRIWVEGIHDAALVERIWGDDLRIEGIVVEPLNGIDDLPKAVQTFAPSKSARLGVLVDHLVAGSKESRIVADVRSPHVLVTGHPYVDIWQAVKPASLGIDAWPVIERGQSWKEGICAALGVADPQQMWRQVLASVNSFSDVEVPLLRAVEELIDFVTEPAE